MLDFALWMQPSWIYFVKNYLKIIPIKYNFKLLVVFDQLSKIRKSNCIIDSGSRVEIWIVINITCWGLPKKIPKVSFLSIFPRRFREDVVRWWRGRRTKSFDKNLHSPFGLNELRIKFIKQIFNHSTINQKQNITKP